MNWRGIGIGAVLGVLLGAGGAGAWWFFYGCRTCVEGSTPDVFLLFGAAVGALAGVWLGADQRIDPPAYDDVG